MYRVADFASKVFHLCGNGKDNNWSVRVADYFFVDCGCCWFWRGVILGAFASSLTIFLLTFVISYTLRSF